MRNLASILLVFILAVLTPVLLIVASVRFNILTTQYVKNELASVNIYGLATAQIDEQIGKIKLDPQYPVTHAEIASLAHDVVSEAWLRQSIEGLLDRVDGWLTAPRGTTLSLPLDLRGPKQRLTAGVDALLIAKLPQIQPCPKKRKPMEEQGLCQFAGLTLPQLKEQLSHQGLNPDLVSEYLPDTLDLLNPDLSKIVGESAATNPNSAQAKSREIRDRLEQFKARYQQVTFLLNVALAIIGLMIALHLTINATAGWRRLARWGGVLLLSLGLVPLALAVASGPLLEQQVLPKIHFDANTPEQLAVIVPAFIRDTGSALFSPLLVFGVVLVGLGLAGIIGAHWLPKRVAVKKDS